MNVRQLVSMLCPPMGRNIEVKNLKRSKNSGYDYDK